MSVDISQHQIEIQRNLGSWQKKPLLQKIYGNFYKQIISNIDNSLPGKVLELGSGIGNLKSHYPTAITSDLFENPWLDLVCDGYELPVTNGSISHLVLFDVFHHLEAPVAFFNEAKRVLCPGGRVILFEPFISVASFPVYGILHHEPVALLKEINVRPAWPRPRSYYAAQGNATRLFFRNKIGQWLDGWEIKRKIAFSTFNYLFSGGFSKPSIYPPGVHKGVCAIDDVLTHLPNLFGGRCLVVLSPRS